jgi:lipoprotein-anchoring transpeptidase ErfK/SrfK
MNRIVASIAAVFLVVSAAPTQASLAPLRWEAGPVSGQRITIDGGKPFSFTIKAAAADPKQKVRLSLLGASPMQLRATVGNPAVGVVQYTPQKSGSTRSFSVTVVARLVGTSRLALTRTVVIVVRAPARTLVGPGPRYRWAFVLARTAARSAPKSSSKVVTEIPTGTSDGRPNLVLAIAEQSDARGRSWVRVRLTDLPNGKTGWVPKTDLSEFRVVQTLLVVDTKRLTLTLFDRGHAVFRAPVGVGRQASPTPRGFFYVREKLTNFHNPFYGPIAFGTSARSAVLTDWPGGGIIGIHGTNTPALIPGQISHGCIRLRNDDILRLARRLPLGTPLIVR